MIHLRDKDFILYDLDEIINGKSNKFGNKDQVKFHKNDINKDHIKNI